MKIRVPITVLDGATNSYVPPGTEVDLPEAEALSLIERFGPFDNQGVLSQADLDGVENLNRFHSMFHNG